MGMTFRGDTNCDPVDCAVPPYLGLAASGQPLCPSDHMVLLSENRHDITNVVGCLSDCKRYNSEDTCCPGEEWRNSCPSTNPWFKQACPNAYNYAFADESAMKFCHDMISTTLTFTC